MNLSDRPSQITTILSNLDTAHSADVADALETYISALEAKQSAMMQQRNSKPTSDKLPVWSHKRMLLREQNRQERALLKRLDSE